jgi:uncharacterized membrane protein YhhN
MEGVMVVWLILALIAAFVEVFAVQKKLEKLEPIAKPAVVVFLLVWLYTGTGLRGNTLWFGLGILFSLIGDVVLINPSDRMFLVGLIAFLFTHIFYLIGFEEELLNFTAWSFILLFLIYANAIRLLRRIVGAMRTKRWNTLVLPVILYSLVISLMLYAAMSTIFDPSWTTSAAFFVSVGAFLFYLSDLILGWDKFVTPIINARILNIVTYYLGQIGLIAGIISQFHAV